METLIDFLINNYVWFLVIALILIFALIGYLVDMTKVSKNKKDVTPISNISSDETHIHPSVEIYTNDVFDDPLITEKNAK